MSQHWFELRDDSGAEDRPWKRIVFLLASVKSVELERHPNYPEWDWTLLVGVSPLDKPLYVSLPAEEAQAEYDRLTAALEVDC